MRRLLIALLITIVPSFAIAGHGGGGHGGGHMGGGSGGHVGGWGGPGSAHIAGTMGGHVSGWSGHGGGWGHRASHGGFAHHHRHGRFFFAGGPWVGGYGYYDNYGYDCWRWAQTPWGLRRVWVCDYY